MREISNTSRPYSSSRIKSQDENSSEISGWEVEGAFDYEKKFRNVNVIDYVNKKISLKFLLDKSKLHFNEKYSPSGWAYNRACPFPDHNDKTPSFYYNNIEDRFFCHGCHRGGKAVHFYAYLKKISILSAAEILATTLGSMEDVIVDIENEKKDHIDDILLDFSDSIHNFIKENNSDIALDFVEKITWALDLYLVKHVSRSSINEDNLRVRASLLKEKLNSFNNK